jgi:hypothetical protein
MSIRASLKKSALAGACRKINSKSISESRIAWARTFDSAIVQSMFISRATHGPSVMQCKATTIRDGTMGSTILFSMHDMMFANVWTASKTNFESW